jgi:hypothetical protein
MDLAMIELAGELLSRWDSLDMQVRERLARALLARAGDAAASEPVTDTALRGKIERLLANKGAAS